MKSKVQLLFILLFLSLTSYSQKQQPKNVIFMIGDGMGINQVQAALIKNKGILNLLQFPYTGLQTTHCFDRYITDSAAAGTALATGKKTKYGMLGMTPDSIPVKSILEVADKNDLATGMVVTCNLTHATPASYIAHQVNRNMTQEIAADFLNTDFDVVIGGGRSDFEKRKDKRNLITELKDKGYQIAYTMDDVKKIKNGKLAAFLADNHLPTVESVVITNSQTTNLASDDHMPDQESRGNYLPEATQKAIELLQQNKKGFFLMVEGSQIDFACHANNIDYATSETIDFDKAVGAALEFAKKDGNTLVIVTADHETGGLINLKSDYKKGKVNASFNGIIHTGSMVPVFAYGPGAEQFSGIIDNTVHKDKIAKLLNIN